MTTLSVGRGRAAFAFVCVLLVGLGCSRDDSGPKEVSRVEGRGGLRVEQLFGKYVTTDYAWCSVSTPERPEAWAREHLYDEAAILPEVFAMGGVVVLGPRYEIHRYPRLSEGDVAEGVRRTFSDFYGAGSERDVITLIEVYKPQDAYPRQYVEVIDDNTLWDLTVEAWLFEWRREGAKSNPIPLKERWRSGNSR